MILGLLLGAAAKWLDITTTNLGNIFSELSIWILLGAWIAITSKNPRRASLNVFLFCAGMLFTYYLTAELTGSVYSKTFIYGWSVVTLFSPLLAYVTWHAKSPNALAKMISAGIIAVALLASALLFDGPRLADLIIVLLLGYLLFIKKIER